MDWFTHLFDANPLPMWVHDVNSLEFLAVNDAAVGKYGYSREEFLRMRISDLHLADASPAEDAARRRSRRHVSKTGTAIDVEISSHELRFGEREATLVTVFDITDRLREQTLRDSLTGLPNRVLFEDRLRQAVQRAGVSGDEVAVLIVDLDDFKNVNDIYDRKVGDQILIDVAARLKSAIRHTDTVARVVGDEFAVLIEASDRDIINRAIVSIRSQFADPFIVGAARVEMTSTIGIADTAVAGSDADALMRCANAATVDAQSSGSGRYQVYDNKMHRLTLDRLGLAAELRGILTRDELHVEYQPIVSLPGGDVHGAEALIRWRHPVRGAVGPDQFIPVAERSGLIVPIGIWVLRTACQDAAAWPQLDHAPLSLSVNVSSRQLREPGFSDDVARILDETGLEPSRLVLEVTESVLVDDVPGAQLRLAQLRSLGVRIALDDFGAGYSSLGYLRSLPLDVVKIDRMFIASLADRIDRRSLILGVIRLLQTLRVTTVAEGIETADQLEYMSAMGVDRAQGFYFARPMPGEALLDVLRPERAARVGMQGARRAVSA